MGAASGFFLLGSTKTYRGPFAVSLGVLYLALCPFSGRPISEAGTAKAVHTKRQARDPYPPQSVSKDIVHWDASSVATETWGPPESG